MRTDMEPPAILPRLARSPPTHSSAPSGPTRRLPASNQLSRPRQRLSRDRCQDSAPSNLTPLEKNDKKLETLPWRPMLKEGVCDRQWRVTTSNRSSPGSGGGVSRLRVVRLHAEHPGRRRAQS